MIVIPWAFSPRDDGAGTVCAATHLSEPGAASINWITSSKAGVQGHKRVRVSSVGIGPLAYTLGQPADVKPQRAQSLIIRGARRQTAVLLLQSLAEFSYVATRKLGVSVASVRRRVNGWCGGFPVHPAVEPDLTAALDLVSAHNISFWDALLCATSIRMGLSFLLTEDLQDERSCTA
jgi:predicted nucleic acid-binding protein